MTHRGMHQALTSFELARPSILASHRPVRPVRCECQRCGAHTLAERGLASVWRCGICASSDLRPVAERERAPALASVTRLR